MTNSRFMHAVGSLRNKLLLWFSLLSIIPLIVLGTVSFFSSQSALQNSKFTQLEALLTVKTHQVESYFRDQQRNMNALTDAVMALRDDAFNRLAAVRTIKKSHIEAYFASRKNDINMLSSTIETFIIKNGTTDNNLEFYIGDIEKKFFTDYKKAHNYNNLYLISETGDMFFSVKQEPDYQTNLKTGPFKATNLAKLVTETLNTKQFAMSDFDRYAPSEYEPAIFIAQAIIVDNQVKGAIALRLSIENINSIMQEHTGFGDTGETYLIGIPETATNENIRLTFRSDSRLVEDNTILNSGYTVSNKVLKDVLVNGANQGVILNYKSDRVLSSWDVLDIDISGGMKWVIIAEVGVEEAFTPSSSYTEQDFFTRYKQEYNLADLFLISPAGSYIFYTVEHKPDYQTNLLNGSYKDSNLSMLVKEVLRTKQLAITDFAKYVPSNNAPAAFIAKPLLNPEGEIDVIVAVQLTQNDINTIMHERTGLGQTGETYLVGTDLLWRNDSRFLKQLGVDSSVLNQKLKVDTIAANSALEGQSNTRIINNYKGDKVLSSWMPLTLQFSDNEQSKLIKWAAIAEIKKSEVDKPVINMAMIAAGLVIVTAIVVISAIIYVSNGLSAPIVQVAETATAIALGDFQKRVRVKTGDEIEKLGKAFNSMAEKIAGMVHKLEQENTERKRAEEAANAANKAKSSFLSNMSHELRTPMNAILGFSQLMMHSKNLSEEQHDNLSIIVRSGDYLLTLINQVLDLSKIEAGRTVLNETSFDLYHLLTEVENIFRLKAQNKNIQLSFTRADDVPRYICTDEVKLRQVLINLLNNSLKFTEKGGVKLTISEIVTTQPTDVNKTMLRRVHFEIEDTGHGIAEEELGELFEAFVQSESGKKVQEGTGLGLPISRKFVQLMGGDILVESEIGHGSVFKFDIKVRPANKLDVSQHHKTERRVIALESGQPNYRILIVDDEWASRQLLVKLLGPLGFEHKEAANGQEAVDIFREWLPHLIWMDMRMPVLSGYDATKIIKADPQSKNTIVIALTASSFKEERAIILAAGCDDFMHKPFWEADLFNMMQKHIGVKFIYEESDVSDEGDDTSKDSLTADSLATLPDDLLMGLEHATEESDMEMIDKIISGIRGHNLAIANELTALADEFDYDQILKLIKEAKST